MTESDYIEATNLAKIRIAVDTMREVLAGYGPVTKERLTEICGPLGKLLDDCFASIDTSGASKFTLDQIHAASKTIKRGRK